jgi:hypothetical protein
MADLKPGETYVAGATSKIARQLLDAAAKAGLNPKTSVRSTEGGFIVPDQIAPTAPAPKKRTARALPVDPPPEPKAATPRRRKKSTTKEG